MNKISFISKRSHAITLRTKFWDVFKSRKVVQTPYLQPSPHTYEINYENGHKTQITDEYLFVKDHLSRAKIPKSTSDYLKQERDYLQDYVTQEKTITHYAKQIEEIRSKLQMGPENDRVNSLEIVGEYLYFEVQLAKKRPIYVRINAPDINVAMKEVTNDAIFTAVRDLTRKKKQETMSVRSSISLGGALATMQVVLDQNVDLPDDTVLTKCKLSPSQRYVAYLCDSGSSELIIRDVQTRKVIAKINDDSVTSVEFSDDELSVYVTSSDEMHRSCQLSRYNLQTRTVKDIYHEKDTTFFIEVTRTKDDKYLLLNCANKSCNQNFIVDGDELKPITSREEGIYNAITSDGSEFVIVTNRGSPNHKVMRAPMDTIADLSTWKEYVSHSDASRIDDIDVFSDRIALYETYNDGFGRIRLIEKNGNTTTVPLPDMVCVSPGVNQGTSHLTFSAYSPVLIPVNYMYDLETGMLSKTNVVAVGAQDEITNTFTMERHYATSHDGEQVPLTIVFDRNQIKKNGQNPVLVHCYGAYGSSLELNFEAQRLVLLKQGFIVAFAHVRGGSEKGSEWHKQGTKLRKLNSFHDLFACTQFLIDQKYTCQERVCVKGVSAGAMLAAGGMIMRPDLFNACVVHVGFLDVLTTMLDTELPLTEHETEEWGDPLKDQQVAEYMRRYSPYELLLHANTKLNSIMITGALEDYRAPLWNMIKFMARIRRIAHEKQQSPLLLFRTRSAGHFDDTSGVEAKPINIALENSFIGRALNWK